MTARVLILSGASSTGKTTVARELQKLTLHPTVFIATDDIDLPKDARAIAALRAAGPDIVASLQLAMFRAFYEGLSRWPANGVSAIAETIFRDADHVHICQSILRDTPHVLVRLYCSRDVRLLREQERRDRQLGLSDETALTEVIPSDLDFEIDTTQTSPAEAAAQLVRFL